MRILITVKPRMYRESLGLAIYQRRPRAEILLAPPESLDGQAKRFAPQVILGNGANMELPKGLDGVVCRIQVLFSNGMDAEISLGGRVWKIEDMCINDLIAILDEVEGLIQVEMTQ